MTASGLTYAKHERVRLRDIGRDERWLQDRINEDPSILGLGELKVWRKEREQPRGGRIDFVLEDPETEVWYEVEVMLGATDESHIIRTLEYWDKERRRYFDKDHRAVIVAEEITSRFFNVIWLLNRSIPIIAVQLNALVCDGKLILNFTKVLDIFEPPAVEIEEIAEPSDRSAWEKWASPGSLKAFDATMELLHAKGLKTGPKYRKNEIVLAARNNFAAFDLVQKADYCRLRLWPRAEDAVRVREELEKAGIIPNVRKDSLSMSITQQALKEHGDAIAQAVKATAESSGGACRISGSSTDWPFRHRKAGSQRTRFRKSSGVQLSQTKKRRRLPLQSSGWRESAICQATLAGR